MAPQRTSLRRSAQRRNRRLRTAPDYGQQRERVPVYDPPQPNSSFRDRVESLPDELLLIVFSNLWNTMQDSRNIEVIGAKQFWTLTPEPGQMPTPVGRQMYLDRRGRLRFGPVTTTTRPRSSMIPITETFDPTIRADFLRNKIYLPDRLLIQGGLEYDYVSNRQLFFEFANAATDHQYIERLMIDYRTFKNEFAPWEGGFLHNIGFEVLSRYGHLREVYLPLKNHSKDHYRIYIDKLPDYAAKATYRSQNNLNHRDFAQIYIRHMAPVEFWETEEDDDEDGGDLRKESRDAWNKAVRDYPLDDANYVAPRLIMGEWNRFSEKALRNLSPNLRRWIGSPFEQCQYGNTYDTECTC